MATLVTVNPANLGFKGPLLLTGFFTTVLQQHFFTPAGVFDDALKEILWRPDNPTGTTESKIYIDYALKPKPKQSNFRPAILVNRGAWKRERLGIHDTMGDMYYGPKASRWHGTHSFNCLAKAFSTAEILGHEVASFFEVYGTILAAQICLEDLFVTDISEPKLLPEDNETYSVNVAVKYAHFNKWSLQDQAPKSRHIRPVITVQDYEGKFEPKTTILDADFVS